MESQIKQLPVFSKIFYLLITGSFLLAACSTVRPLSKRQYKSLDQLVSASPVFRDHFTGFALYDPQKKQMLYQQNADKYFTPASNTKLYTFYTALKVLGDSLPVLHYQYHRDTLIFWGAGNPMVLHPDFPNSQLAVDFLKSQNRPVFFYPGNFQDNRYGPGWAWGDYSDYYQVEKASLPLYGNVFRLKTDAATAQVNTSPDFFQPFLRYRPDHASQPRVQREENGDVTHLKESLRRDSNFAAEIPFDYRPTLAASLLQIALKRPIALWPADTLPAGPVFTLREATNDTLYRRLLHPSDNFVAEQLLLMCADQLFDTLNTAKVIAWAKDSLFADLPDPLQWWDGSGLSRYNLFTPRTTVALLDRIYRELPAARIRNLLPAGGVSGTIRSWYGAETPYVFAKTGSLRNHHCLSGYVYTRSGRVLVFSFMHNNYTRSSTDIRKEMQKVLAWIREL